MENKQAKVGFIAFVENWNARLAILGFVIGAIIELIMGQCILSRLGLM
jgi:Fe2+ transport system protein FeoA